MDIWLPQYPNVRHWSVWVPLVFKGNWTYKKHGIMDLTHLRFFTKNTARRLFQDSGLEVYRCEGAELIGKRNKIVNMCFLGLAKEFTKV